MTDLRLLIDTDDDGSLQTDEEGTIVFLEHRLSVEIFINFQMSPL